MTLLPTTETFPLSGCFQPGVVTCHKATINLELLTTADIIQLPGNLTLQNVKRTSNSAVFQAKVSEAAFTWRGQHVAGHLQSQGISWVLEGCGEGCYLWIEQARQEEQEANYIDEDKVTVEPSQDWRRLQVGLTEA